MEDIRTSRECRKRWGVLEKTNLQPWSHEEDLQLKEAVHASIQKNKVSWPDVARKMQTKRTSAQCWYRWNRNLLISDPLFWGGPNYLKDNLVLSIKS